MAKQDLTNLQKVNDTYYINYSVNGKRIRKSLKTKNYKDARQQADRILLASKSLKDYEDVIHETARAKKIYATEEIMFTDVLEGFVAHLNRLGSSTRNVRTYTYAWNYFHDWMKVNYSNLKGLSELTPTVTIAFADYYNTQGKSAKTYNELFYALERIYKYFQERIQIPVNPFNKVERKDKKADTVQREDFSLEDVQKILGSFKGTELKIDCKPEMRMLLVIGVYTGLRLKDAIYLKWTDIKNDMIYIVPSKTKKYKTKVSIPVVREFNEELTVAEKWKINDYILPRLVERHQKYHNSVGASVMRVLKHNGFINQKTNENSNVRPKYGFHSLRYTFVAICAMNNIPLALVQEIIGHTSEAMTKYYMRFSSKDKKEKLKNFSIKPNPKETFYELHKKAVEAKKIEYEQEQREQVIDYIGAKLNSLSDTALIMINEIVDNDKNLDGLLETITVDSVARGV